MISSMRASDNNDLSERLKIRQNPPFQQIIYFEYHYKDKQTNQPDTLTFIYFHI